MKEYKEYFVAFLDVLGFKKLINTSTCDDIYKIFSELHEKSSDKIRNFNGKEIIACKHIKHKILSDSIIIYVEASLDDSFPALLELCSDLQLSMSNRERPVFLRGGISKGPLYCNDDVIFGDGLTKAYLLESKLAKYPRIIFTGDIMEQGSKTVKYMFPIIHDAAMTPICKQDTDYLFMVDYIRQSHFLGNIKTTKKYYDYLKNECVRVLKVETDFNIREKYIWLNKYINESLETYTQVKDMYVKEKQEQIEAAFDDYSNNFSVYK